MQSVANYLQEEGYVNYALGKWDHTPLYEVSQVGPFDRWPSGEGFDHYYGFMAADAIQSLDFVLVQGAVMLAALSFVLANLLVDLSYSLLDPRIR